MRMTLKAAAPSLSIMNQIDMAKQLVAELVNGEKGDQVIYDIYSIDGHALIRFECTGRMMCWNLTSNDITYVMDSRNYTGPRF